MAAPTIRELNTAEAKTLDPLWLEIEAEREKGNVHRERKRSLSYHPMAMAWLAAVNKALNRPGVDPADPFTLGIGARFDLTVKRIQRIEARWGHALGEDPIEAFASSFIQALGEEVRALKPVIIIGGGLLLAGAGVILALLVLRR